MKLRLISIFLILMFAVLVFSTITTITYNYEVSKLQKISNSFYEKDTLFFRVTNNPLKYNELCKALPMNTVLYSKLPSNSDVRGVIYNGKFDFPNIKSGRFFTENDLKYDSKFAVVGANIPITTHNGKKYYEFNNQIYEVIGILGYTMPTKMDKMVMLTLNEDLLRFNSQYAISGSNLQLNYDFLGNKSLFGEVFVLDKQSLNILHIVDANKSQKTISIIFMFVVTFNTFLLLYFWLDNKNNEIIIKKINGYSNWHIFKDLYKEFIYISSVGLLIGTVVAIIFIMKRYTFNLIPIIISCIMTFFICTIYFIFIIKIRLVKINKGKLGVMN